MKAALLMSLLFTGLALAQDDPSGTDSVPTATPPSPCSATEYRQFGFWVGHWDVTQNGQPAGVNLIRRVDGGCALLERWTSAAGNFTGHSLNGYDRATGQWHQTWMDSSGAVLKLDGGLREGPQLGEDAHVMEMVLEGVVTAADGEETRHRITWTPNADGTVRQHWQSSVAGGAWTTAFDGLYTRRDAAE